MGTMRRLLQDRVSASAVAVLVACLLLIQGLLVGTAHGAMAASAADPFHVICSMSRAGPVDQAGHDNAPLKKVPECPCGAAWPRLPFRRSLAGRAASYTSLSKLRSIVSSRRNMPTRLSCAASSPNRAPRPFLPDVIFEPTPRTRVSAPVLPR
jgi:hypothetical protein